MVTISLFTSLVVILEILGLASIVLVVEWAKKYLGGFGAFANEFNYHPVFMVIGMIFLFGNSIISYRALRSMEKTTVKIIHTCLNGASLLFAVLSLVVVFNFHNKNDIANMYSIHSWVGIATVVLFCCQGVVGFSAFLFPKFRDEHRAAYLKVHVFFGVLVFTLANVAVISGITEKMFIVGNYYKFLGTGNMANALSVCVLLFSMIVGYILYNPSFKRDDGYHDVQ